MASKRRKKSASTAQANSTSDSTVLTPAHAIVKGATTSNTATRSGACTNCRTRKIGCVFTSETDSACVKCTKAGRADTCIPQESRTRPARGKSIPPTGPPVQGVSRAQPCSQRGSRVANKAPMGSSSQKRGGSEVPCSPPSRPSKQPCSSQLQERARATRANDIPAYSRPLDPIPEISDDLDDFGSETSSDIKLLDESKDASDFISALSAGVLEDEFDEESGNDINDGIDDLDALSSHELNDSDSSHETGANLTRLLRATRAVRPVTKQAPIKQTRNKPNTESATSYDPRTCSFTIQCSVRRSNGANAPFEISSDASLDDIHLAVAQRLDRFPTSVSLQYRLDCNKAKDGFTSIQTLDELNMFKARLRDLIVPQRLPSGKLSTRAPKKVIVLFEDAGTDDTSAGHGDGLSMGHRKNGGGMTSRQVAKQKHSGPTTSTSGQLGGTGLREEVIKQLQERWRCEAHSRGPESPVYCYRSPGASVCYPLTHSNMLAWAIEIMDENGTVDEKPDTVNFQTARPRSRSMLAAPSPAMASTGPVPGTYGYPPPVIVMPPSWGPPSYPSQGTNTGSLHGGHNPVPTLSPLLLPSALPPPHTRTATTSLSPSPSNPTPPPVSVNDIPRIIDWFAYLDQHPQRNQDGVAYAPFGEVMRRNGFVRLSQLTDEYVKLSYLQDLLGIEFGTAISIMQYAKQDLAAVESGIQIPPRTTDS